MSATTILFIPDSFVLVEDYRPLFDAVSQAGQSIEGIHLASIGPSSRQGRDGPAPPMYDDAALIALRAEQLADEGKDVILIGHSYGGVPLSQSTKGLSRQSRAALGKPGGIIRLGYIGAIVPAEGQSAADVTAARSSSESPAMSMDENGWLLQTDPEQTAKVVAQDASPKVGKALVERFAKHSAASFSSLLTYAGYKDIPTSWFFCEDDQCISPKLQMASIGAIEATGQQVECTRIKCGHCPHVTAQTALVDWILSLPHN